MSHRPRRWIAALLVLIFSIGTLQAASALPHRCPGEAPAHAMATPEAADFHAHVEKRSDMGDDEDQPCPDCLHGMSAKDCAAFCLVAVPLPALVRLVAPELPAPPVPALDRAGQGWLPPRDARPPRTTAIG
ncbi:MAG: hypothetical protein JWM77_3049 [Rhodospirillales bacterium]|nr:hypothetical protein [Rhodospirillales bacterium]